MSMTNKAVLKQLGLPSNLLKLIKEGRLEAEVERAWALIDAWNDAIDAWEALNPEMARQCPWFEAREAWKAAGRPKAQWWEALQVVVNDFRAVRRFGGSTHGGNEVLRFPRPLDQHAKHREYQRRTGAYYMRRCLERKKNTLASKSTI